MATIKSIEEKAKAYDEAIERAKGAHNGAKSDKKNGVTDKITEYTIQLTETIFPSLKESEDERMRNAAINACKYMVDNFENSTKQYEDAISWLEKQGEQNLANSARNCKDEQKFAKSEDERIRKRIIHALHGDVLEMSEIKEAVDWLEKQGEHAKFINGIQVGDKVTRNEDGVLVNLSQLNRVAKKQGEQKPACGEEDEKMLKDTIRFCELYGNQVSANWLKSLKDRVQPQPKQEWSEDGWTMQDEEELDIAIKTLEEAGQYSSANWLKNVCLVPRPKQEWSEEDERMIKNIIYDLEYLKKKCCNDHYEGSRDRNPYHYSELINWLKSLRPRNTWKPSDEQIQALEYQVHSTFEGSWQYKASKELLEQLKKL